MEVKTDAISKAQQIIQKFSEKSDQDDNAINALGQDKTRLKNEINLHKKSIAELQQQLKDVGEKVQDDQAQLNEHLQKELTELREALRSYQLEYEAEKRIFHGKVGELTQELYDANIQRDKLSELVEEIEADM